MKNKIWFEVLVLVLIFVICTLGCSTSGGSFSSSPTGSNTSTVSYYNLGNVSVNNSAFIQVSPIVDGESDIRAVDLVMIDGQGNSSQWRKPNIFPLSQSIVRVTPGVHTFTITFNPGARDAFTGTLQTSDTSINISHNCKAGMGYIFEFIAKRNQGNPLTNPINIVINIYESPINDKGNFGGPGTRGMTTAVTGSNLTRVARHTETVIPSHNLR